MRGGVARSALATTQRTATSTKEVKETPMGPSSNANGRSKGSYLDNRTGEGNEMKVACVKFR
jgi:hypothetical protein